MIRIPAEDEGCSKSFMTENVSQDVSIAPSDSVSNQGIEIYKKMYFNVIRKLYKSQNFILGFSIFPRNHLGSQAWISDRNQITSVH